MRMIHPYSYRVFTKGCPMQTYYNPIAPKKPVNVTLNADLVRIGKDLGLNLSNVAEDALAAVVRAHIAAAWLKENAAAIQAYNERVDQGGVFSDGLRSF